MSVFFALDVKIESRAKRVVQHIMCKKHAVLHRVLYKIFCNFNFVRKKNDFIQKIHLFDVDCHCQYWVILAMSAKMNSFYNSFFFLSFFLSF